MDLDGKKIKNVGGFWWPEEDEEGHRAGFNELWKLEKIRLLCTGNEVAIQAGGNTGLFARELKKWFNSVYVFEPDDLNYECMSINLRNCTNLAMFHAALSDKPGFCETFGDADNCGAHQIRVGKGTIPITTIDNLHVRACDLIYLDVEGHEDLALIGGRKTIEWYKPVIVCENKGLNARYPSGYEGSDEFREWVCKEFGYEYAGRMMRDDYFLCTK